MAMTKKRNPDGKVITCVREYKGGHTTPDSKDTRD